MEEGGKKKSVSRKGGNHACNYISFEVLTDVIRSALSTSHLSDLSSPVSTHMGTGSIFGVGKGRREYEPKKSKFLSYAAFFFTSQTIFIRIRRNKYSNSSWE